MNNPLVSTLICTYNAEKYIKNTLTSVIEQTYKEQEILILDNWSIDKTIEIIKELSKKDQRIKLFSEWKNLWAFNWLNYLIDKSKWKYIAIQDHDDIWHPEKLNIQIKFLESNLNYIWSWTWSMMYYSISKLWFMYDNREYNTTKVIHTSLVFRNYWFHYDTKNDFLCDGFFMQNILTKWKNILKVHPEVLTLHYYKQNWANYSEQWFIINWKNLKRYYSVYGPSLYYTLVLWYIITLKFLPKKIRKPFDNFILINIKKAKYIDELRKESSYYKELLKYF